MDPNTRALMMGAAGAGGAAAKTYVEDVFSTFLYTGNGSTQTITNGIDLSGKGGLVWIKGRSVAYNNVLNDTGRGVTQQLSSNQTDGQQVYTTGLTAFTSTGFGIGNNIQYNENSQTYASWTFRKAPGFFDVVTYTGTGVNRTIAHSLGSVPGCIIIKRTDISGSNWRVYHRSLGNSGLILLDSTSGQFTSSDAWNYTDPTSTVFSLGTHPHGNASGGTYVAYLFAHDAQLFGDGGNQSVIKCGSYTGNGSTTGPVVDLGWEPQWVMVKNATVAGYPWTMYDVMRGIPTGGTVEPLLYANQSDAETQLGENSLDLTARGFQLRTNSGYVNNNGDTYIYIAIRRGPMKTPTDATEVFGLCRADSGVNLVWGPGSSEITQRRSHYADLVIAGLTTGNSKNMQFADRLRGFQETGFLGSPTSTSPTLVSSSTAAETVSGNLVYRRNDIGGWPTAIWLTGVALNAGALCYAFRRAPGFFDMVAYTGTGIAHGEAHNLGVAPELVIWKERSTASNWYVYQGFTTRTYGRLNLSNAFSGNTPGWFSSVTSTALNVCASSDNTDVNDSGVTYIAYLFATLTGISKVGSYTGTGTTLNIDCGFTNGARFVLIKRVNDVGDWYVWDTARGIIAANDPYLLLNSTAAEVTNTDFIDPLNSGFQISSTAPAAINANGGSFIYLAIA